jgi:hypothetical protein
MHRLLRSARSAPLVAIAALPLLANLSAGCSSPAEEGATLGVEPLTGLSLEEVSGLNSLGAVRAFVETETTFAIAGAGGFALVEKGSAAPRASGPQSLVSLAEAPSTVAFASFLAVTSEGRAVAVDAAAMLTDVTARFGLTAGSVQSVANLGTFGIAFVTREGYAVAAGGTVRSVAQPGISELFACGARLFARDARALFRLGADARPAYVTSFPEGLVGAGCDPAGRVLAASPSVLYREVGTALAPLLEEPGFSALVATSTGNAMLRGGALCLANDAGVACTGGGPALTQLFPSRSALPWGVANGALVRIAVAGDAGAAVDADAATDASAPTDGATDAGPLPDASLAGDASTGADERTWTQSVKPVAERACFGCHGTVGAASVTLTTYASWVTNRNTIRNRVVTQRNMPPNASSLSTADRNAMAAWLGP